MSTSLKIIILSLVIIVAGGVIVGLIMYNKTDPDLSGVKADFVVSPSQLFEEFLGNEAEATEKYSGKIIEVTGIVSSFEEGSGSAVSIHLDSGNLMGDVIFTLGVEGDMPGIKEGDSVTLRGQCSGFLMDVLLNNAVIVER